MMRGGCGARRRGHCCYYTHDVTYYLFSCRPRTEDFLYNYMYEQVAPTHLQTMNYARHKEEQVFVR